MKLVSYLEQETDKLGIFNNGKVYPVAALDSSLPGNMREFLFAGESAMEKAKTLDKEISAGQHSDMGMDLKSVKLTSPVPHPTSCRDAYAFRQHVATARRNRGVEMIPEFDQFPVFYFTNHNIMYGPGEIELMPDHFKRLDFELEVAIVVGKKGKNIPASEADNYIAGYMIMNDISARQLQMEEMKLNLGPAKGKDLGNACGPYMVTPDELQEKLTNAREGHKGNQYNLTMKAFHNGEQISEGNFGDMDWSFAEILERVSYGVDIYPGDVIGSGTVGTGCYLELNGSRKLEDENYQPVWLQPGDEITLEVDMLGTLTNKFKKVNTGYSILEQKKNV